MKYIYAFKVLFLYKTQRNNQLLIIVISWKYVGKFYLFNYVFIYFTTFSALSIYWILNEENSIKIKIRNSVCSNCS